MRNAPKRLSLVMPAFNEEAGIAAAVREAVDGLGALGLPYEIIVVDDGSTDRTARILKKMRLANVRVVGHNRNEGYGAALRSGFEAAQNEWVAFTDADGQFFLEDIGLLLHETDESPIVVGRRVHRQDPWMRRFYSWGYNRLIRTLLKTGVRDCDCALKVFRRDVLRSIMPTTRGFFVNAEMICKARSLGVPIREVGVRHRPRRHGESKVAPGDIPKTLKQLVPFWWTYFVRGKMLLPEPAPAMATGYPSLRVPLRKPARQVA